MRSVLLHIDDDPCLDARIQVALDLARQFNGHVTCVQPVPFAMGMPGDFYGSVTAELGPAYQEAADNLKARIETDLANEDVSWSWVQENGNAVELLMQLTGLSDVVLVGCCDPLHKGHSPLAGDLAIRSQTPVLVVPPTAKRLDAQGPALVAWDGSPEACRALRAAVPLLALSSSVTLATVQEDVKRAYDLPPTGGAEYLSRHGIASEIVELPRTKSIAQVLVDAAIARKASYLVMGVYGRPRLAEMVLGGVSRELLAHPPLPLPVLAYH